ncbi:NADH-quinone oxidoreductase subunit L [Planctobacterium marinum]|uniref:NADH-quinone oxidoreductase subunit L n=1 Tax=Planctobacterium marinum TaxID=1631968 RepID=UPI001E2F4E4F|nr:NADH-quinone oxidoreductase subunit L [Planctobacterium marinum]MCC2606723.1 NADH-quinone oxidoreductase subunit L [Planctobacterium marinum]
MQSWVVASTLLMIPGLLALMGWMGGRTRTDKSAERIYRATLWLAMGSVLMSGVGVYQFYSQTSSTASGQLFGFNQINSIVLPLVLFIATIIIRFSHNYMAGEACYPRYFRWMTLTITAVLVTLLSNHLVIFWLGWFTISLTLHKLLTLYPERPRAILAAHKKFILARSAELCLLVAFSLLYLQHQTLYIDQLLLTIGAIASTAEQVAALLIALAALIKCAQLPVHGWLIKVVEAPTPVSALLHAGIINLGGFLLLTFAPLLQISDWGRWTVLLVAGISTLLASLILLTRVSVKVRLAWSTSAQMGLMLIEIALGLYELAILHLIAHSLYKAFSFLNSGNAVYEQLQQELTGKIHAPTGHWLASSLFSLLLVSPAVVLLSGPIAPWVLLWMGFTILLATSSQKLYASLMAISLIAIYLALKFGLGHVFPGNAVVPFSAEDWFITILIINMFIFGMHLRFNNQKPWVQRLSAALFAGLYLDEWFTRITLKFWPVRTHANAVKEIP